MSATNLHLAANFALPLEAVTQTFAILGIRGSGKTSTGVVITEELLNAKQQVVVIDPVDVWWGLKSSKSGKEPGFSIPVIGGDHADVPLEGGAGQVLADFVSETRASVILSLRHLSMNDQRRFAGDFAKRLYEKKGQQRSPLMLMVDEADEFVPQRIPHGHEGTFGAFDRLVRRGRSSGIGVTLISQRAQVVNKDVLSQVETLVGMRVLHKLDRKALEAWIEAHDTEGRQEEFLSSLASLGRGDAWIWSPSWLNAFKRLHVRERQTYDSSATPKAGEQIAAPRELAAVDLEKLRAQMSSQIEKAKAEDPRALRKRIAELEAEIRSKPAPAAAKVERIEVPVLKDAHLARLEAAIERWAKASESALLIGQEIRGALQTLNGASHRPGPATRPGPPPAAAISRPAPLRAPSAGSVTEGGLRRMLAALAQRNGLSAKQLGVRAGLSSTSGTFGTYLGKARSNGWIEGSRDRLLITPAGLEALGRYDPLPSGEGLLNYWMSELGGGAARMLEILARHRRPMAAEELGEKAGLSASSGTFGTYLGKLRTLELVTGSRSDLRASEDLWE